MLAMMHPFAPLSAHPLAPMRMHPVDMLDALTQDTLAHHRPLAPNPRLRTTEDEHIITVTAPGIAASDVTIEVEEGRLRIAGTNKRKRIECTLALPRDVDLDGATAGAEDGLITVSFKKRKRTTTHVAIEASEPPTIDGDDDDAYTLTLVAAGFAAADLKLSVEDHTLTVSGESKRTGARLERSARLPRDADVDGMVAAHVDGILTVRAPTKPTAKPRHISVNARNAVGADSDVVLASATAENDKQQAALPSADEQAAEETTAEMEEEAVMV